MSEEGSDPPSDITDPPLDITDEVPDPSDGDTDSPLDITDEVPEDERVDVSDVRPFTSEWAAIVQPVTRSILTILAAVILLPFTLSFLPEAKMALAIDWAKTVLSPVVGFSGAVVGYYFGSRTS